MLSLWFSYTESKRFSTRITTFQSLDKWYYLAMEWNGIKKGEIIGDYLLAVE